MNKLAKEEACFFDEVKKDSQLNKSLRKVVLPFRSSESNSDQYTAFTQLRESCFHMNCKLIKEKF